MQAARGTSVGHPDDGPEGPAVRTAPLLASRAVWLVFAVVATAWYAADQWSKRAAVAHLADRPDVDVVGSFLQLHLTYNPGAAFSLGTQYTVALSCLAVVATGVVLWISRRVADRVWAVALGLLLAGIAGNLTDRLLREPGPFRGHVVDFLQLPNWPVFNVADIGINVGAALVVLQVFRGIGLDGGPTTVDETATEDPVDAAGAAAAADEAPDDAALEDPTREEPTREGPTGEEGAS